ncbi:DUF1801 domain-containing protein [Aestuariirhabdus sp. Z084]|uniref:DUF1801 domain-containing protein n=1 Tax=Aestuariirhabdus haliotis TaxID=2918751 RepID=UPI00201B3714|nr:DUF1801 domain-containing protein [Aestuariirhabdus haliotis]MCL6416583.1 DUF1801 domain-containing protein [Aestuariirhabdus haliotis]MCL6420550.1 DUF1801 domain-containing protein [Aestuariirhabdus haliotis]
MNASVIQVFASYPDPIRHQLIELRTIIFTLAKEQNLGTLEESLKWGEPSYRCQGGTSIRIGWKSKRPRQYRLLFHCQTRLISTFRELYGNRFDYEDNRAIVFDISDTLPVEELKHCLSLALRYHKIKHSLCFGHL